MPSAASPHAAGEGLVDERAHVGLVLRVRGESSRSVTSVPDRWTRVWCGASGHGGSCVQLPQSATVIAPPGARSSPPGSRSRTASCANARQCGSVHGGRGVEGVTSRASVRLARSRRAGPAAGAGRRRRRRRARPAAAVEGRGRAAQPQEKCLAGFRHSDCCTRRLPGSRVAGDQAGPLQPVEVVGEGRLPDADGRGELALGAVSPVVSAWRTSQVGGRAADRGQCVVERPAQRLGRRPTSRPSGSAAASRQHRDRKVRSLTSVHAKLSVRKLRRPDRLSVPKL